MRKNTVIGGYQNTRTNGEDFAITPYIFGVFVNRKDFLVVGIGLCWAWSSMYIGFGIGIPKDYPAFKIIKTKICNTNKTSKSSCSLPVVSLDEKSEAKVCHNKNEHLCEGFNKRSYCKGCLEYY